MSSISKKWGPSTRKVDLHAERQLILLSAGTADRRRTMRSQAQRLMFGVDWPRLEETLRMRRLLPTLGPRIVELGGERTSDDFAAAVEQAVANGRRRGAFLQLVSMRVTDSLADAGIRSAALKGPLLSEALYGDPGRRVSNDIDLLVATEQLPAAVDVVRQLGYAPPTDYLDSSGLPALHFALSPEDGELPPVEIHWRIHWYERSFARERLLPSDANTKSNWRPDPVDELAALLLFYARDGFVDLRLATDLGAWWDAFGVDLQPGALDDLMHVYPAFARIIPVAARVAENIVGLPAEHVIRDMPTLGFRDRLAMRLTEPNPQVSQHQLFAEMGLIDGLLMPSGDFSDFFRRKILPPREVLNKYAQGSPTGHAVSPLGYSMRVLARYGLALGRAVCRPETLQAPPLIDGLQETDSSGEQARQTNQGTHAHIY